MPGHDIPGKVHTPQHAAPPQSSRASHESNGNGSARNEPARRNGESREGMTRGKRPPRSLAGNEWRECAALIRPRRIEAAPEKAHEPESCSRDPHKRHQPQRSMEGRHQQQSPIGPIEQQRQQSIGNHKGPQASRMLPQNHRATLIALAIGRNPLVLSYHPKTPFFRQVRPTTPHLSPPFAKTGNPRRRSTDRGRHGPRGTGPSKQKRHRARCLILIYLPALSNSFAQGGRRGPGRYLEFAASAPFAGRRRDAKKRPAPHPANRPEKQKGTLRGCR